MNVLSRWVGLAVCVAVFAVAGCDAQSGINDAAAGRTIPGVTGAKSLSSHYVEVTFADPVGESASDAARYVITDPQSGRLSVTRAETTADPNRVLLTTDGQQVVEYGLRVDRSPRPGDDAEAVESEREIAFAGDNGPEPCILYAIALNNTQVLITFDLTMDPVTTQDPKYYEFTPQLGVSSVVMDAARRTAVMTTNPQQSLEYSLRVTNVKSGPSAYYLIDPVCNEVAFTGIPPVDNTAPKLMDAQATSGSTILLRFNEPMSETAANPANYSISPNLLILGATQNSYKTLVTLETLPMTLGASYTVTTSNLRDMANPGNLIDPSFVAKSFTFNGAPALGASDDLPRVVNAIATSDTSVVVTFNKPMGDSADVAENYRILGPETSFLFVKTALRSSDKTSVRLTTTPQADLLYTVLVGPLRDLSGNPMAAPDSILAPPDGVDPSSAKFMGRAPDSIDKQIDSDGDGNADWFETMGWEILVELSNGGQRRSYVTSDPFNPDTDGDGLGDALENANNWDARTSDTDVDLVDDFSEYNVYYSSPTDQDSDDDGIDDNLERDFFLTSPILDDTDGDGFTDDAELFTMSRNPLIADLPLPQIKVQDIAIELNITTSYTDEEGTTQSQSQTTSTTFGQSRTETLGTSDTATTQSENEFGQEIGFEGGFPLSFSVTASSSFSQSLAAGFSSTVNAESASTSSQEYQESITSSLEFSQNRSVTRNIESAIVQATVNIANKSDLAFSITNIELSLLQQDRTTGLTFVPIAALRPTGAADTTAQPIYNLGPLDNERGPIIFENTTVFPNRIDALMREPVGLIFEVVNFDVFDEAGRNLVFTSQDVVDRTVGITIDFGDGRVESYRVATASTFDENGKPVGISLLRALEIAGLTKEGPGNTDEMNTYETALDSRLDEDNNSVDVEVLVRVRDVENTVDGRTFWTAITSDDRLTPFDNFTEMVMHSHESILLLYTSDLDADGLFLREEYLYGSDDEDTDSDDDTLGDFFEVRTGWSVAKVPGLPYKVFPSPARPDSDLDGLDDKKEFVKKTDPNRQDTDLDGLSDSSEIEDTYVIVLFDGNLDITDDKFLTVAPYSDWAITAGPNGTCNTAAATGDDTLVTQNGTGSKLCIASGPNGTIDTTPSGDDKVVATAKIDPGPDGICQTTVANPGLPASCTGVGAPQACCTGVGTGPTCNDDVIEYSVANNPPSKGSVGKVCISAGANDALDTAPATGSDDFIRVVHKGLFATDPVREDTDLDGIGDGREGELGINPNSKDAGKVVDTDGDGLFDDEEEAGWAVQGYVGLIPSDKNHPDTDRDGIPDVIERAIASHPNRLDTDGDTILDYLEFETSNPLVNGVPMFNTVALATAIQQCNDATKCSYTAPLGALQTDTNPTKADTDTDGRNDNVELNVDCSWQVYNGSPQTIKTDPRKADEDGDGRNDGQECVVGGTNPKDADTDDDLRNDGAEATAGLNPLRKDKRISVTLNNYFVDDDCDGATLQGLELEGAFQIAYPTSAGLTDGTFYTATCQGEEGLCDTSNCCCKSCDANESACTGETFSISVASSQFIFQEGESFTLKSTELKDNDDLGGCGGVLENVLGTMSEVVDFSVSLGTSVAVPVGSTGCQLTANYTITIHN